jgi:opacity protein-like surface antigen
MKKILIVAALAWTLAPSTARADWMFTPYVGGIFGGVGEGNWTYGGALGWMGDGILGVEADLGFNAKTDFFNADDADLLGIDRDFLEAGVTTLMGNVLVGYPFGGTNGNFNPYLIGGIGWFRTNVNTTDDLFDFDSHDNNFGMDLGAGAFGFMNDRWGFRGDVRWYYSFEQPSLDFDLLDIGVVNRVDVPTVNLISVDVDRHFWRATGGVTYRW